MWLCNACSKGWHVHCLPRSVDKQHIGELWLCPPCIIILEDRLLLATNDGPGAVRDRVAQEMADAREQQQQQDRAAYRQLAFVIGDERMEITFTPRGVRHRAGAVGRAGGAQKPVVDATPLRVTYVVDEKKRLFADAADATIASIESRFPPSKVVAGPV